MTLRTATALFALAVALPALAGANVVVSNQSSFDIHNLYMSSSSDPEWGPDQLGELILGTGTTFTLTDIECDTYDIKIVDEDGDSCVIKAVPMCEDTSVWSIDDASLIGCQLTSP